MRRELRRIARVRLAVGVEAAALLAAVALIAWAVQLGAGETPETATLLLLGLAGASGGALRFVARLAALLAERCPRCGGAFFVSMQRLVWSLPFPSGRCAHCDVGLRPPPSAGGASDPDPSPAPQPHRPDAPR